MKRSDIIKYFWEELNVFPVDSHTFKVGFKHIVNASIERAIIRSRNKGKTMAQIIKEKKENQCHKTLKSGRCLNSKQEHKQYCNKHR